MAHVATITIDHTKVPGDLTDYVGLIVPDGSAGYSALYALCLEGGGDIRLFKSDDTTELAREIVTFSVTDETGEIHYKYSGTLSSSVDTAIHVYADGSSSDYAVGATYGRNAVWSASYAQVYHMNSTTDSTGNSRNLSAVGGVTLGGVAGEIGKATDFDGSNDSARYTSASLGAKTALSIQFWANPDSTSSRSGVVMNTDGQSFATDSWGIEMRSGGLVRFRLSTSASDSGYSSFDSPSGALVTGAWNQITLTRNAGDGTFFKNGASLSTTSGLETGSTNNLDKFGIGSFGTGDFLYFNGKIDEVRIVDTDLSANYITAEYNNQNSYSTFYSVAAVAGGSTSAQTARRGVVMMM